MDKFTDEQVNNWRVYEQVRQSGKFSMFDPRARARSGLTEDEYKFCRMNYSKLKEYEHREDEHDTGIAGNDSGAAAEMERARAEGMSTVPNLTASECAGYSPARATLSELGDAAEGAHGADLTRWIALYLEHNDRLREENQIAALARVIYPTPFGHDTAEYHPWTARNWATQAKKAHDKVTA